MKIIDEFWSEEHKQYCLTIATKFGHFSGVATCSPEDIEKGLATKWDGMDIAFYKAVMEYAKAKAAAYRQRAIGAKEAYDAFKSQYSSIENSDKVNWYDTYDEKEAFLDGQDEALDFLRWQYLVLYRRYREEREIYQELKDNFNNYVDGIQTKRQEARNLINKILSSATKE